MRYLLSLISTVLILLDWGNSVVALCTNNELRMFHTFVHYRMVHHQHHMTVPNSTCEEFGSATGNAVILPVWKHFDWVVYENYKRIESRSTPSRVICQPQMLTYLIDKLFDVPGVRLGNITLVVAGDDLHYSYIEKLVKDFLAKYAHGPHAPTSMFDIFGQIWWEAKDTYDSRVRTIPEGLNFRYVGRNGIDNVLFSLDEAQANKIVKNHLACAAWGGVYKGLDSEVPERAALDSFLESSVWVKRSLWSPETYFSKVATHEFMFCPKGTGVQSPKFAEAWLVHTIPIAIRNPAFIDLEAMGFPIYLVDSWTEVTELALKESLLTKFKNVNWDNVRYMLTTDYVATLLEPVKSSTADAQQTSSLFATEHAPHWLVNFPVEFHVNSVNSLGVLVDVTDDAADLKHFVEFSDYFLSLLESSTDGEMVDALEHYFWGQRNGVALELGALDGSPGTNSMTYEYEKGFNWKRVLVEGDPKYRLKLPEMSPKSFSASAAICEHHTTVHFSTGKYIGGILEFMSDSFMKQFHQNIYDHCVPPGNISSLNWEELKTIAPNVLTIDCVPLSVILQTARVKHVNFFILDVEGGEYEVLKSIDWDLVRFDVICVETDPNHRPLGFAEKIMSFLATKGYTNSTQQQGRNTWYTHQDFVPSVRPDVAQQCYRGAQKSCSLRPGKCPPAFPALCRP